MVVGWRSGNGRSNRGPDHPSTSGAEVGITNDLGVVAAVLTAALLQAHLVDVLSPAGAAMLQRRPGDGLLVGAAEVDGLHGGGGGGWRSGSERSREINGEGDGLSPQLLDQEP